MAYAQWIEVKVVNDTDGNLQIQHAHLKWGKFYKLGDKDHELSVGDINGIVIKPSESAHICSCGRSDSPSGTEGSFEIFAGSVNLGEFIWDCPWDKKKNDFSWRKNSKNFIVDTDGGNYDSGAIGNVTLDVIKKPVKVPVTV